ncbi:MAG TPA: hypothetical protein VMF51_18165 [Nocardioides sp.]|uniref:hypothetical protein n=1 Tax=Nocardioides sp. TaxID=35761 RepID=UPI002C82A4CF|nr:hypothetical protein [Nocardioides sp.]HTW17061.1 hypothetical protein [Nocardioides sp.]
MSTDWTAWLGPAAEAMTDEQRERFEAEAEAAIARIGDDPDLQPERDTALAALTQYLLGETDIDEAGRKRQRTREAARHASIAAQQVALLAVRDGMAEAEAGRRAGLDRMTVRKLLGKI